MVDSPPPSLPAPPAPPPRGRPTSADLRRRARLARHPDAGCASDPAGPYAGARRRCAAGLIDLVLACLFLAMCFAPAIWAVAHGSSASRCAQATSDESYMACEPDFGMLAVAVILAKLGLVPCVAGAAFRAKRTGLRGASFGQRCVRIRLVDATTGLPIGGGRVAARWALAMTLSAQPAMLGYLWMLWDDRHRTWHDLIVRSVVVRDAGRPAKGTGEVRDGGADDRG